jgi:hypothetical protein
LKQKLERFVGDQILRVIEINSQTLDRQPFPALGIVGKEIAEMRLLNLFRVSFESLPGLPFYERVSGD